MTISLQLRPSEAADPAFVRALALEEAGLSDNGVYVVTVIRRAIDARPKMPRVVVHVEISTEPHPVPKPLSELRQANPEKRVVIVGAGPAGYFAALELLKYGITPVVVDRGKNVRDRRRDLRVLQQEGIVNPHSNYCLVKAAQGRILTASCTRVLISAVMCEMFWSSLLPMEQAAIYWLNRIRILDRTNSGWLFSDYAKR